MNDLEKAIEKARLQRISQSDSNNNSRDMKARSFNPPEIRAADNQRPEGADEGADSHEASLRNSIGLRHATNGASDPAYDAMNGESYSNHDAINGNRHSNYEAINGNSRSQYDDINVNGHSNYDATNGNSFSKYNGTNKDSTSKYNKINGDSHSSSDVANGANNFNYEATKTSPNFVNENSSVCVLPLERMQSAGFITPTLEKGKLTEEYRRIKRPLLNNLRKKVLINGLKNVIAVTSSVSGEGKTYSAVNLAMSMAVEKDRTVLLLDADVVKGAVGRLFSISPDQPGLTDVLSDDSIDVADVIVKTNVKKLRFMSGGTMKSNTNELLASDLMGDLIVELARRYDDRIIILDCPPILQTNEANILVDHAGQVVFVVAEEETRQKQVSNAINQIDKEKYVGVLVNKSSSRVGNYDYYHRYNAYK